MHKLLPSYHKLNVLSDLGFELRSQVQAFLDFCGGVYVNIMKVQSFVHDLYEKKILLMIARLTLTFDLVTLTLCQLNLFIDINHASKFHLDRIIRSCFIDESIFSHNC